MLKRIYIYLKEMYPPFERLLLATGLFFTIYFVLIANNQIYNIQIGTQELICILTIFSFLLSLRIADEFKDLEGDYQNFPNRPLPSGRVTKRDLIILLIFFQVPAILFNALYMNNLIFFGLLYAYGILMSFWFFAKTYIQKNLALALLTHNPVQLLLNLYIVSFICIKYGINIVSSSVILAVLALYLPGLIWEISRKIRSPKAETQYVTYSKLWGYKRATFIVSALIAVCTLLNVLLVINLSKLSVIVILAVVSLVLVRCSSFARHPDKYTLLKTTTAFIYTQELILLFTAGIYILSRQG
jgi:4-hydroxybenzoate polyprenyltransferase